jgi:hypothetical protein
MPNFSEAEMMADLAAADAAGDARTAQHIAGLIKAQRAAQPSKTEATVRGMAQGGSLGWMDELQGLARGGAERALADNQETGGVFEDSRGQDVAAERRRITAEERGKNAAARKAHGGYYLGGQIAGGALPAAMAPGSLIAQGVTMGAVGGLGDSEANSIGGMARDAAVGGALGGAMGVVGQKVLPRAMSTAGDKLHEWGLASGRRALRGGGGTISVKKPLGDESVMAAYNAGAFGGRSVQGTSRVLEDASAKADDALGAALDAMANKGMTGAESRQVAASLRKQGDTAFQDTAMQEVRAIYHNAADALEEVASSGKLGLRQGERIKTAHQRKVKYDRVGGNDVVGDARADVASTMRRATENAVADQASLAPAEAAAFIPLKDKSGALEGARRVAETGAARAAQRNAIFSAPNMAAGAAAVASGNPMAALLPLATHAASTRGASAATSAFLGGEKMARGAGPRNLLRLALAQSGLHLPDEEN